MSVGGKNCLQGLEEGLWVEGIDLAEHSQAIVLLCILARQCDHSLPRALCQSSKKRKVETAKESSDDCKGSLTLAQETVTTVLVRARVEMVESRRAKIGFNAAREIVKQQKRSKRVLTS